MNIESKIIEILAELSGFEGIDAQHTLQGDLGLDSLSMVTMLLEFEEYFGIELDQSDMNPFDLTTVADAVTLVEKYRGGIHE